MQASVSEAAAEGRRHGADAQQPARQGQRQLQHQQRRDPGRQHLRRRHAGQPAVDGGGGSRPAARQRGRAVAQRPGGGCMGVTSTVLLEESLGGERQLGQALHPPGRQPLSPPTPTPAPGAAARSHGSGWRDRVAGWKLWAW